METKPLREALAEMPAGSTLEVLDVLDLDESQRRLAEEAQFLGVSVSTTVRGNDVQVRRQEPDGTP